MFVFASPLGPSRSIVGARGFRVLGAPRFSRDRCTDSTYRPLEAPGQLRQRDALLDRQVVHHGEALDHSEEALHIGSKSGRQRLLSTDVTPFLYARS